MWSECDGCAGSSTRTRECNSPPTRFGGLPCIGERRQRRGCHDNTTVCSGQHDKGLNNNCGFKLTSIDVPLRGRLMDENEDEMSKGRRKGGEKLLRN